jgi:hypothetical protein
MMKRIVCCNAGPALVGSCDPYVCLGEREGGGGGAVVSLGGVQSHAAGCADVNTQHSRGSSP